MWPQNKPGTLILLKTALNVYFVANLEIGGSAKQCQTIIRQAYGFGSVINSIGLNPKTLTTNPLFPELADTAQRVYRIVYKVNGDVEHFAV